MNVLSLYFKVPCNLTLRNSLLHASEFTRGDKVLFPPSFSTHNLGEDFPNPSHPTILDVILEEFKMLKALTTSMS